MRNKKAPPIGELFRLYKGVAEPAPMKEWRVQQKLPRKYAGLMGQFLFELVSSVDTIRKIRAVECRLTRSEVVADYIVGFEKSAGVHDWRVRFMRFLYSEYRW